MCSSNFSEMTTCWKRLTLHMKETARDGSLVTPRLSPTRQEMIRTRRLFLIIKGGSDRWISRLTWTSCVAVTAGVVHPGGGGTSRRAAPARPGGSVSASRLSWRVKTEKSRWNSNSRKKKSKNLSTNVWTHQIWALDKRSWCRLNTPPQCTVAQLEENHTVSISWYWGHSENNTVTPWKLHIHSLIVSSGPENDLMAFR